MRSEHIIVSFLKRNQLFIISIFLALFSLHLALTDKKEVERGFILKEILSVTVTPMQKAVLAAEDGVRSVWHGYINLIGAQQENDSLKNAILALQQENNRLKEEVNLNGRLKTLLEYRDSLPYNTVAASVIGLHNENWTHTVTINKGKDDGIVKELAVISPVGVAGRIIEVNSRTSKVLLNTDIRSNVDVLVQRSRIKGVAEGTGTDGLTLKYVRQIDDVQVGDEVITSGLSGVFPKGLIVGEVSKVEKGNDSFFKHIEVRPKMDIRKLEELLVVTDTDFNE